MASNLGTQAYEKHISQGFAASAADMTIAESFLKSIPASATASQKADVTRRLLAAIAGGSGPMVNGQRVNAATLAYIVDHI